ncbi:MAG: hypothetical protein AB8B87_01040 [Granulosicoccus sp.]
MRTSSSPFIRSVSCAVSLISCVTLLSSCVSQTGKEAFGISAEAITPRLGGNREALELISAPERAHLQLIATNMISTLVQIPRMQSGSITLQINKPQTAYGNAVVRALEDAGFGLQQVNADQGQNYVSYSKRLSETESGLVTDYELSVGKISLRREYSVQDGNLIYPSSLLTIDGTDSIADIELSDSIFVEQGGRGDAFISGVQLEGEPDPNLAVKTVDVRDYDELPADKRTPQADIFDQARLHFFEIQARRDSPPLDRFNKHRRTVLIFDDNQTQLMGATNKQAVRLLVREFSDDDIMIIKACLDADGSNDAAMTRAIRVEQELLGFGIPPESTYIAPCARASYRHSSDDSPTPVELVHYRPKTL